MKRQSRRLPKETEKIIKDMKAFTKAISKSAEECRKFLYKAGFTTKSGKLKKPYR